jgi:hypothetical protein
MQKGITVVTKFSKLIMTVFSSILMPWQNLKNGFVVNFHVFHMVTTKMRQTALRKLVLKWVVELCT